MSDSHLHVLPPEDLLPLPAVMPREQARRWFSPFEEAQARSSLAIFITQSAYQQTVEHAASEMENEVGGVLVGNWCSQVESTQQFIVVETALKARFTRSGSVFLTFTQDSLVDLHTEMDEHYAGKQIVGWYHTHPGLGVFLSHYDAWLHTYFFPESWQVALVIEPVADLGGFFVRQAGGELDPSRYYGFYELNGGAGQSLVHWRNLRASSEADEQPGETDNE